MSDKVYCKNCIWVNTDGFLDLFTKCDHESNIKINQLGRKSHKDYARNLNQDFKCKNYNAKLIIKLLNYIKSLFK